MKYYIDKNKRVYGYNDDGSEDALIPSDFTPVTVEEIKALLAPESTFSPELASKEIRKTRDELLASSDWTQLADISPEIKSKWAPYRQALRDVTSQSTFPASVVWPSAPGA